jgi:thiamine phosphate synthase YjbQ (UPF0047 family)
MSLAPVEVRFEVSPRARFDVIDVTQRVRRDHPALLQDYSHCLYCSFHTTAGYLDQRFAMRLRTQQVASYLEVYRTVFPEDAGYLHDELDRRTELTAAQRENEPRNADSHLAFISAGLRSCVTYRNDVAGPVCFIDLDGVNETTPRRRTTTVLAYRGEEHVARLRLDVPVSDHPVDSVNLKDPSLGLYAQVHELIAAYGIGKGRIQLELASDEREAGLTVNEYETLLMRHDLAEVLRDPFRFFVEKGRNVLADPRAVPAKTLGYAKYDLVRTFNRLVDAFGLNKSIAERWLGRALAVPASRFLRMKRSVSLLVSDGDAGRGSIVEGLYQSPILVQWRSPGRAVRHVDVTLTRFI